MVTTGVCIIDAGKKKKVESLVISEVAFAKNGYAVVIVETVEIFLLTCYNHCIDIGSLGRVESIEVFISAFVVAEGYYFFCLTNLVRQLNNPLNVIGIILAFWRCCVTFYSPSNPVVDIFEI